MKRRDGYLVIDDCKKIETNKDKDHYWIYIDSVEYYFKPIRYYDDYSELIAYYGGMLLGIDMCYYDLAVLNGRYGYISKSLRGENVKLVSGDDILLEYIKCDNNVDSLVDMGLELWVINKLRSSLDSGDDLSEYDYLLDKLNNLEIIWQALEYKYKNLIDINKVMNEFVMMYLFTILFVDIDKHSGNWFIIEDKNGVRLAPLLDNELILNEYCETIGLTTNVKDNKGIFNSLEVFFDTSSSEYFDLFISMYNKLRNNFDYIFDMIEKQLGIKFSLKEKNNIYNKFDCFEVRFSDTIRKFKRK